MATVTFTALSYADPFLETGSSNAEMASNFKPTVPVLFLEQSGGVDPTGELK